MMKKTNNNKNKEIVHRVALYGVLIAMALVLSFTESQLPAFFAFPGMKLGLTNIVVLLALYRLGSGSAMALNLLRIAASSLLFGGMSAFLYSLAGGMLSTLVMILLKKAGRFSPVPVSIAGGVSHNLGQILVAMVVMNTASLGVYMSVLWFTGMASGAFIGLLGGILIKRLPDSLFGKGSSK